MHTRRAGRPDGVEARDGERLVASDCQTRSAQGDGFAHAVLGRGRDHARPPYAPDHRGVVVRGLFETTLQGDLRERA